MSVNLRGVVRDFVFGMEDGLVSNLGLVLGVYVGGGSASVIILAGLASMFAGAFSMSAGSYLSAKSQREVYEAEIKAAEREVKKNPLKHLTEMSVLLRKEGFDKKEVDVICTHFARHNQKTFAKNYIQKKVGLFKRRFDLPWQNAITMFFSFLAGSAFPIVPFILFTGMEAAVIATVLTIITLFTVGVAKTRYTGRAWYTSGLEVVLVGLGAGIIGYVVGLLVG